MDTFLDIKDRNILDILRMHLYFIAKMKIRVPLI